uniref:alpha-protein kinase 3 isoform X1 n=1 Tax=Epinephelus lanceolatus TaxID=310571 RepID=UPI001447F50E|nr:alpha-protein kinase 3 isoform X1 [Epinephelus lanceolatus]XP_033490922.1 alpha-protein kinase 3 isoform X1 [Epinephelus lanceolatus]XP_033490923.1 alpha-protein kinase 3 isoform X1 [Epinephelus lanceolatus]XP_033490924.1 alpha-protein kinase 3 isoform X1 [Epinephelus lanceolatus]
MTSRRPMTRSFSGNGRTSSFSEEEGNSSNGPPETRNPYLSNVRPENSYSRYSHYRPTRSTLCSVMAQLTEDVQPSFETTLKSKAVSENCNVKFSCVVTGYPAPELKWYKDDMEMDRYCGLPKYEIRRNGKIHTLHIYNCTLDDAAIYQVSASNSKGIVSCSGVLEVGTMNEFQIHQRFFAKLKQKAEKKKKDMEVQAKQGDKENIQKEKPQVSPERPPRKRHIPKPEEKPAVKKPEAVEQLGAAAEPNGIISEVEETAPVTSKDLEEISPSEETMAKKKIKISNGVDAGVNGNSSSNKNHMMGNGGENCYDGGFGLAQFLAEALQAQAAEEKLNSARGEKPVEMDSPIVSAREQERMRKVREEQEKAQQEEYEREKRREEELAIERERERERALEMSHTKHGSEVRHHGKARKDHEHHNIQTSISSVLHSVKDFFFGKSKKDSHEHIENKEREASRSPASTPPSFRLQQEHNRVCKPLTEDIVSMEIDKPKEPLEYVGMEQSVSLKPHEHKHEDRVLHTDLPAAHKLPPESVEESTGQSAKVADGAAEAMEVSVGLDSSSPGEETPLSGLQVLTEAEEKDSHIVSVIKEVPLHQHDYAVVSSQLNHQPAQDESSPREEVSVLPQTQAPYKEECPPTSTPTSLEESWTPPRNLISTSDNHSLEEAPTGTSQEEKMSVKMGREGEPDTDKGRSSSVLCEEEKAEVKSNKQSSSDINRPEVTELTTRSVEERIEPTEPKTPDQVLSPLPAVAAYGVEGDHVKEQTGCTSLIQEMNLGLPPTEAPESLEKGDLNIQQEHTSTVEVSAEGHNVSAMQSSNTGLRSSEEGSKLEGVLISASDLEVNSSDDLKTQEQAILEGESTEAKSLQFGVEAEKRSPVTAVESDESKSLSVTQNQEGNAYVLEERSTVAHQDSREGQQGPPLMNIPQIQISIIEDTPDIKPPVAGVNSDEQFIIPKIEIMEPELKECTLPLTILALNKQESEPATLQNHDVTLESEVIIQDQSAVDSPSLLPTQRGMQNDINLSPMEKVKEVAQLDDETKMFEQPSVKGSEQLPQMDYASVPVINVSCTDDKEGEVFISTRVSDTQWPFETPTVPVFVVPPISITCHESDSGLSLPAQNVWTETETSAATQRGTKRDTDNNNTTVPEKNQNRKQDVEETSEKSVKENTTSVLNEALTPKVGDNVPSFIKTAEDNNVPEILKTKSLKEAKIENSMSVERLCSKPPAHPSLSPASLRKFMSKAAPDSDAITGGDKADEDLSGGSTPTSSLSCESSPRLKRRDSLSLIRSATPEELASGARRKIFIPKTKEDGDGAVVGALDTPVKKDTPYMSPSQARRAALLQAPTGQNTPPVERRSPLLVRRKATLEVPKVVEETPTEEPVSTKQEEKPAAKKFDPLKAPQVIRKIRGEPFPDASGHLKLWCQFFNVLSDSTIKWYREEEEILEVKRSGGDESQVALAVVLASNHDCGVYGCSISNEYGSDTTDFLLSVEILSEILLKDDLEVGEEIEMTPLLFTKGLADSGSWGEKYFGRIMTETAQIGEGCAHKTSRVKVIYGLDPIFESGSACVIKVQSPIPYGTTQENNLTDKNLQITKQECKVQNMIREYCKIFAAEARILENFGFTLEVIPQYLMYRPANSVPYATVEADLMGDYVQYCGMDSKGKLISQTASEVEQKCSTFQHWLHQWTHGNLLVTRLEGVESKMTNIRVVTKPKGYQGLTEHGSPEVFEQFLTHHQCNYYCGLLGLRPLKSLEQQSKVKGSRSPLLNRRLSSSSPQVQRKGHSPQMSRKANSSPKVPRKAQETEDNKLDNKPKPAETVDALEIR